MAEEPKNALIPVADYEVLDQVDDQAIIEMMTGQAIRDYVYSFKQGGKTVEGLTLAGINEAANRRGGIEVNEVKYEEREHSWIVIVKATDTLTGSSRYGAYEQAKMAGGRPDPFAFTKAIHKAQRNAIKQLLPVPIIKEVLKFYLHRTTESAESQMELPTESRKDKISNAQKAAFVVAGKLEGRFEPEGITKTGFWNYVKRRYAVESRNDMTEWQWTQLSAELNAAESSPQIFKQLIDRIRQLDSAVKSSEIPENSNQGRDGKSHVSDATGELDEADSEDSEERPF
ncbi:hypothetical protein HYR99_03020 [Candidatus Poribacteria bacterium]|nr:hypothetical protein [Candidatus Poribacteria bacterium]